MTESLAGRGAGQNGKGQGLPPVPRGGGAGLSGHGHRPVRFRARHGDDAYELRDGDRVLFGRDDEVCDIPVWQHIEDVDRAVTLSRVAGELLCDGDVVWVTNLSESHELHVEGTDEPGHTLGRRRPPWRGPGRSLPLPQAELSVPSSGMWRISVTAVGPPPPAPGGPTGRPRRSAVDGHAGMPPAPPTASFPEVPARFRNTAGALCAPLLEGGFGREPASYAQVAHATGLSPRMARRQVDRLCRYYGRQLGAKGVLAWLRPGEDDRVALARLLVQRGAVPFATPPLGPCAESEAPTPPATL